MLYVRTVSEKSICLLKINLQFTGKDIEEAVLRLDHRRKIEKGKEAMSYLFSYQRGLVSHIFQVLSDSKKPLLCCFSVENLNLEVDFLFNYGIFRHFYLLPWSTSIYELLENSISKKIR